MATNVVVLPRQAFRYDGSLRTGGNVLQMEDKDAKAHASEDMGPTVAILSKKGKEGLKEAQEVFGKARAATFRAEFETPEGKLPDDEVLDQIYGEVSGAPS